MKCDFVAVLAWLKRCSKWRVVYAVFTFMGHSGLNLQCVRAIVRRPLFNSYVILLPNIRG